MAFLPIYYLTLVCPTTERTMEMAEQYIEHGAQALQFDMPSREPSFETPLVQEMMAKALALYEGYSVYMDVLCALKRRHPETELHLVVYPDVIESIGEQEFFAFCRRVPLSGIMLAVPCPSLEQSLSDAGLPLFIIAGNNFNTPLPTRLSSLAEDRIAVINYKRPIVITGDICTGFANKLCRLRELGMRSRIFAVEGVADAQMMHEVRDAGACGALVGNVLMQLWNNPKALWEKFASFQALCSADEQERGKHNEL